jgi:hypothetical protein
MPPGSLNNSIALPVPAAAEVHLVFLHLVDCVARLSSADHLMVGENMIMEIPNSFSLHVT